MHTALREGPERAASGEGRNRPGGFAHVGCRARDRGPVTARLRSGARDRDTHGGGGDGDRDGGCCNSNRRLKNTNAPNVTRGARRSPRRDHVPPGGEHAVGGPKSSESPRRGGKGRVVVTRGVQSGRQRVQTGRRGARATRGETRDAAHGACSAAGEIPVTVDAGGWEGERGAERKE